MHYDEGRAQQAVYREQIAAIRERMRDTLAATEPEPVDDYVFHNLDGEVRLSDLFAGHDDLILIHNMGGSCPNCTLWADGYNGIHDRVAQRAGFAVTSPDTPEQQRRLAESHGWAFPMVSHAGTSFAADMGYVNEAGRPMPGVSVFRRDGGAIVRVSDAGFHPGDDFCTLWHFFDLIPARAAVTPG